MGSTTIFSSSFDSKLRCPRCEGLRISETHLAHESHGSLWLDCLRCLNCGFIEDPTFFHNRHILKIPQPRRHAIWKKARRRTVHQKRFPQTF